MRRLEKIGIGFVLAGLMMLFVSSPATQPSVAFATTQGGPIVLDGMDPVCHAVYNEATDQYIAKVLKSVYDQSSMPSNTDKIAILGVSSPTNAGGCGGDWSSLMSTKFLAQFSTAPVFEFISSTTDLNTFFSTTITSTPPRMIWIPDDWSRSGAVNTVFTNNAESLADFVNSGGGLFSNVNTYGWLTALLPSAVFNNGGCNGGPEATADGMTDFDLNNQIVAACWHGYFTGDVGTLKTLVDYPYPTMSDTRKAVSIGGGAVSLPSSFTLGISPQTPEAGQDLTITALAQTLAGVPQAGVTVNVTVSAGPDAGQTFTAVTDASGVATIIVRTSATGTATYTATAVVNGVSKTVSATVTWNPPATTVPPTTTLAPSTTVEETTTTVPVTAVEVVVPTTEQPPLTVAPATTVHDHSSHSHGVLGKLPQTGMSGIPLSTYAFILIIAGLSFMATPLFANRRKSWKR